jgi:hypothetical protein
MTAVGWPCPWCHHDTATVDSTDRYGRPRTLTCLSCRFPFLADR